MTRRWLPALPPLAAGTLSSRWLCADAGKQNGRGLVGGILLDQTTLEGGLEDGLAEDRCPAQLAGECRASGFRTPQLIGQPPHDMMLFPKWGKRN